jgi:hypothetical protein
VLRRRADLGPEMEAAEEASALVPLLAMSTSLYSVPLLRPPEFLPDPAVFRQNLELSGR